MLKKTERNQAEFQYIYRYTAVRYSNLGTWGTDVSHASQVVAASCLLACLLVASARARARRECRPGISTTPGNLGRQRRHSIGIAVGIMIGLFSYVRSGLVPLVAAIFPIPKIALLPLFVIWFGIGEGSKYALIAFGTFTPTVVATYGAVDNVDRTLIRMGQSFGLSWWSIVRKIVLPGAMPGILSGLRISLSIAIILLVAAEMLGAEYGIGAYILEAGSLYDLERLFAGVVILSLLGVLISALIGILERRLLGWRT